MNICIRNQEEHIINTIDNLSCSFMKKKLFYFVFVALTAMTAGLLSLTSCSKDDEKNDEKVEDKVKDKVKESRLVAELQVKLVGEWKMMAVYYDTGKGINEHEDIRDIFNADGTLITLVNGKENNREKWRVEVDGDKKYLYKGSWRYSILALSQDVFDLQFSPPIFNRYQRMKTVAPPRK